MTASIGQAYTLVAGMWRCPGRPNVPPLSYAQPKGRITRVRSVWTSVAPPPSAFVYGTTKPRLIDPINPTATDNVGWDGAQLTVMDGDQTVPTNTTWTNRQINGDVTMTDSTSKLVNCLITGRPKTSSGAYSSFKSGMVNGSNGGQLIRCTLRPSAATLAQQPGLSQPAFLNGITCGGGAWTVDRCDISLVTDAWHKSGGGTMRFTGNQVHDYCFWDNDPDQQGAALNPGWNHADTGGQVLSGVGGDYIMGNSIQCFFDVTGVVWSGGAPGSGTASGGLYGTPKTALNAGYVNTTTGKGTWGNGLTYSNAGPAQNVYFGFNWIDGCNHPSGMVQYTSAVGTAGSIKAEGNRFGLGGKRSSTGRMFLFSWPSGTAADWSGAQNIFDPNPAVSTAALAGQPLPAPTAGGIAVTV